MVFSYHVSQERSQYRLTADTGPNERKAERITAYSGEVFVDAKEPYVIVRLTTRAENIPSDFPIQRADSTLDYKYVDIGGQQFLLPYNGEVRMDGPDWISKNSNRFDFYRKYEVGSSITFDLPGRFHPQNRSQSQGTPPPDCKDPKNKDVPACKQ